MTSRPEYRWLAYFDEWWAARERARTVGRFDTRAYEEILEIHSQPRPLTPGELIVLELVRRGLGNREIACQLGITPATVSSRLQSLKRRLRVRDRAELAEVATALRCRACT